MLPRPSAPPCPAHRGESAFLSRGTRRTPSPRRRGCRSRRSLMRSCPSPRPRSIGSPSCEATGARRWAGRVGQCAAEWSAAACLPLPLSRVVSPCARLCPRWATDHGPPAPGRARPRVRGLPAACPRHASQRHVPTCCLHPAVGLARAFCNAGHACLPACLPGEVALRRFPDSRIQRQPPEVAAARHGPDPFPSLLADHHLHHVLVSWEVHLLELLAHVVRDLLRPLGRLVQVVRHVGQLFLQRRAQKLPDEHHREPVAPRRNGGQSGSGGSRRAVGPGCLAAAANPHASGRGGLHAPSHSPPAARHGPHLFLKLGRVWYFCAAVSAMLGLPEEAV